MATRIYSANSVFKMMISAGRIRWRFLNIRKLRIPPTVRLFLFLLIKGKVLTRDVMRRRNFHCGLECEMCNLNQPETAIHLFFSMRVSSIHLDETRNGHQQWVSDGTRSLGEGIHQRSNSHIVCDMGYLEKLKSEKF